MCVCFVREGGGEGGGKKIQGGRERCLVFLRSWRLSPWTVGEMSL
jgi:hypothetical protein